MRPDDQYWGFPDDNGSYNGMLGQLQRGEADYSPAAFTVTFERQLLFDFLTPIFNTEAYLYIKNPKFNVNWYAYLSPLVWEVWLGMAILFFSLPFVISLSATLPPRVN